MVEIIATVVEMIVTVVEIIMLCSNYDDMVKSLFSKDRNVMPLQYL